MDEWFYDIINLLDDPADNILVQRHLARQTQLNKDFFFKLNSISRVSDWHVVKY